MRVRMKVEGGDKLARKLQMISEDTARKHMRESVLVGAEHIKTLAEAAAPRRTGTLAGDIQVEVTKQTKSRVEVEIGPGKEGWYGFLVEEGHKSAKVVRRFQKGRRTYRVMKDLGRYVEPRPWLGPTFEKREASAQELIVDDLRRRIESHGT